MIIRGEVPSWADAAGPYGWGYGYGCGDGYAYGDIVNEFGAGNGYGVAAPGASGEGLDDLAR